MLSIQSNTKPYICVVANKKDGNVYDKIFRENAEHFFIPLIEKVLQIKIISYKALTVKFPKTSEREVDFLYEITQAGAVKQILHLEFQSSNDPKMLERMQEYHAKIYKKFKLPVRPVVVNLSQKAFTARTQLNPEEIFTGYQLINLFELSTNELLSNQVPEVVILALLADYKATEIEAVLRLIVKKLKQIVNTEQDLRRYLMQLLFLSRMRNFEEETTKILDNMPITYDIEKDSLYQRGVKQGIEKGIEKGVMICYEIGLLHQQIAEKFEIDISEVMTIINKYKRCQSE